MDLPPFRRPIPPAPIEPVDLAHSGVPPALGGLTILHISDTHVRRYELNHPSFQRVLRALRRTPVDLVALTGDYMTRPGNEPAAVAMLRALAGAWTARLGAFGIFGNHDSPLLIEQARDIAGITWLENRAIDIPGLPLRLIGASYPEDLLGAVLRGIGFPVEDLPWRADAVVRAGAEGPLVSRTASAGKPMPRLPDSPDPAQPFPIVLCHYPTEVFAAADLGLPLVLAGHTHGGQFRLSPRLIFHTASDLPGRLATGVLRLRNTLVCVSRGLGEGFLDFRFNCPQQMPLYRLRAGHAPEDAGGRAGAHGALNVLRGW